MGRTTDAAAMALGYRRMALTILVGALLLVAWGGDGFAQEPAKATPPKAAGAAGQAPATDKPKRSAPKKIKANPGADAKPLDAEAALDQARKALTDGKIDLAGKLAGDVLGNSSKTPRNTARALAVRGEFHLQKGRVAEAIVDLDGALWVAGGLQGAERESATVARQRAMQQAGLGPQSAPAQAAPAAAVASAQVRQPASAPAPRSPEPRGTEAAPAPAPAPQASAGGGIGTFFSNIFSNSSGSVPTPVTGTVAPAKPSVSSSEPQRGEGDGRAVAVPARAATAVVPRPAVQQAPAPGTPAVGPPASVRAAASSVGSGARIQLAAVRSREEADALARRVKTEHKDAIGSRTIAVEEEVYGNMGRFYRVRIGPFASVPDTQSACARIRNGGIDCMAMTAE